jgi:hypothetical protein
MLRVDEFHDTVDEVAYIFQKQFVVTADKRVPGKLAVACFWSMGKQKEALYIGRNTSLLSRIAENADTPGFRKFAAFIREVVCGTQMMQLDASLSSTNLGAREDDGMEYHVILSDELIQLNIIGVPPPFLPLVSVAGGDRDIPNTGIEPGIYDLLLVIWQRNLRTPLHVPGNAPWF